MSSFRTGRIRENRGAGKNLGGVREELVGPVAKKGSRKKSG